MSRGGRGGRGGGRGGRQQVPWLEDPALKVDGRPAEAFPPYDVPIPSPLTDREKSQVRSLLLFREQVHDGPFYTATRSWNKNNGASGGSGTTTPRAYGQAQINQRYGVKNKATVDPFTAVEMPSSRMRRPERALPDFSERPFAKHLFPPELHPTLDDEDGGTGAKNGVIGNRRKKTMTLSKVTSLRTAEQIFNMPDPLLSDSAAAAADQRKALEVLEKLEGGGGGDGDDNVDDFDLDDEEGMYGEDMDEEYDDEDGGDYDAENYFDNGDDDDMGDDGGDDGGVY